MSKKRKVILTVSLVIIIFAVFVGSISAYALFNIDYSADEILFEAAKSSSITTLYYDASGLCGADIKRYVPIEYETVSYGGERKLWYSYAEISDYLKSGFVAMEDRGFFEHRGVNIKRSLGAFLNYAIGRSSYGGSTITQQVVKNISGDNEHTVKRKVNEILRAIHIEKTHTKEEIFEMYLNIAPMSENIVGVGRACREFFGKEPSDISIAEAATLIGIANAPTRYNPYNHPEECRKKRDAVLFVMYDQGCISEGEYNEAISEELVTVERDRSSGRVVSWFAETVLSDMVEDFVRELGISYRAAEALVYNGGFSVYTTLDPIAQRILEEYFENSDNFPRTTQDGLQFSMAICSSLTGNLCATVGSVGKKSANRIMNYAQCLRAPGSVLKPLSLYAPLIDAGKISWSTVLDDVPLEFKRTDDGELREYPHNSPNVYSGLITVSDALRLSKNTVALRLYNMLGAQRIYNTLNEDYELPGLVEKQKNSDGGVVTDLAPSPLALGQLSYGTTLRSLTEAYTVFSREGVYSKGKSYILVLDLNDRVVLRENKEQKRILSTQAARVMTQLMMQVTDSGTAAKITLKELFDVAGKTGTSGGDKDKWFIGYTPYYTAGIWCGYADNKKSVSNNGKGHLQVWDEVMHLIHSEAVAAGEVMHFSTEGLLYRPYCMDSGQMYSPSCMKDPRGARVDYGYFIKGTEPRLLCERHILCSYDLIGEGVDLGGCPSVSTQKVALIKVLDRSFPKEIFITDAQYVYRPVDKFFGTDTSADKPFFSYMIPEGEYVGISKSKRQFNRGCNIHR